MGTGFFCFQKIIKEGLETLILSEKSLKKIG